MLRFINVLLHHCGKYNWIKFLYHFIFVSVTLRTASLSSESACLSTDQEVAGWITGIYTILNVRFRACQPTARGLMSTRPQIEVDSLKTAWRAPKSLLPLETWVTVNINSYQNSSRCLIGTTPRVPSVCSKTLPSSGIKPILQCVFEAWCLKPRNRGAGIYRV